MFYMCDNIIDIHVIFYMGDNIFDIHVMFYMGDNIFDIHVMFYMSDSITETKSQACHYKQAPGEFPRLLLLQHRLLWVQRNYTSLV